MHRLYLVYGILISLMLTMAHSKGTSFMDWVKSGSWNPSGRSAYHK